MCAHLKDRHPNCVDICVLRGKLFSELPSKSELIREKQLWCHPPSRAPQSVIISGVLTSHFINNHGKPEVPQASAAFRIYQDVDLATSFGVVTNCIVNHELTPLRSPWTIFCPWRYSNPVTAPTSYPDDQYYMRRSLSFTHETQTIVVLICLDKFHDISVDHSF